MKGDCYVFKFLQRSVNGALKRHFRYTAPKPLISDKFERSIANKLSLYSEIEKEVRFEPYLKIVKNVD